MKMIVFIFAALLALALFTGSAICCMASDQAPRKGNVKSLPGASAAGPGEILVKFKPGVTGKKIREIARREGLEKIKVVSPPGLYLFKTGETSQALVNKRISDLQKYDEIEYAEPNYLYKPVRD